MKEAKKYPVNPLAHTMSDQTRLRRYHQDKDKMFRENVSVPAEKLAELHEALRKWWNV